MLRLLQMPKSRLGSDMWGHWERPVFRLRDRPAKPADTRLLALHRYWEDASGADELPGRGAVFPVRLPSVLPHVFVLDVVGSTFRFRLRGTEMERRMGRGRIGLTFEECGYGNTIDEIKQDYLTAVREHRAVTTSGMVYWGSEANALHYENTRLPVANESGAVVHLLCAMVFHEQVSA